MQAAVIWDVDGTLVDTGKLHFDAWVRLAVELERPFTPENFKETFGRRNPEIIRYLFGEHLSDSEVAELGERKERYYRKEAEKGVELLPGVRALLEECHCSGVLQAIGSSAPRANLEMILDLTRTQEFFQAMIGMEDTVRGKPDPEVFLKAAVRLGVAPADCVVLEDAVAGIQAAKAGGMKAVAVRFVGHHSEAKLKEAGADRVVESLKEISLSEILRLLS